MTHVLGRGCRRVRRLIGMTPDSSKVLVLFVGFDRTRYARAHAAITTLVGEFARGQATLVRIDNAQESLAARETGPYEFTIGGDNTSWEFSGWQRGLDFAIARGIAFDHAVFVNDAFLNGERGQEPFGLVEIRALLNPHTLAQLQTGLLGRIDFNRFPVVIDGLDAGHWVRSCAFAMDRSTAEGIRLAAVDRADADRFLPREFSNALLLPDAPVNREFAEFLTRWISMRWRRAQQVDASNWPFIRGKLTAILNERLLTARLRANGVPIWGGGPVALDSGACTLTRLPDARISSAP
jgi:hypothetical protein